MKRCPHCQRTLPLTSFYRKKAHRASWCRECLQPVNRQKYLKAKARPDFKAKNHAYARKWHARNRERINAKSLTRYHQQRQACLQAYGGHCACCGETRYQFLALDHIYGGGNRDQITGKRGERGAKLARVLYRRKFPPGFRVLCHNCNAAFGFYGYCPHNPTAGRPEAPEIPQLTLTLPA
jgi:hypothetical protein